MANGTLTLVSSNVQYKKYKYTYSGTAYAGIHVFTTLGKTSQSIAPAISMTKVELSTMNPEPITGNKVIAKTNCCMHSYSSNKFYGFFYQGDGYDMYVNGEAFSSVPTASQTTMYNEPKFWPSFCVKTDGTAIIRWFPDRNSVLTALPYCKCILAGCHPLVFNSLCVLNERVYDSEVNSKLIFDPQGTITDIRYNGDIGSPNSSVIRTLLGHKSGSQGVYIMVSTDAGMTVKVAANLMQDLGCDYAVNMDGSSPVQMRIASGYGASGRVTSNQGRVLHTAVCAHLV